MRVGISRDRMNFTQELLAEMLGVCQCRTKSAPALNHLHSQNWASCAAMLAFDCCACA
jgi:hypothetical protein